MRFRRRCQNDQLSSSSSSSSSSSCFGQSCGHGRYDGCASLKNNDMASTGIWSIFPLRGISDASRPEAHHNDNRSIIQNKRSHHHHHQQQQQQQQTTTTPAFIIVIVVVDVVGKSSTTTTTATSILERPPAAQWKPEFFYTIVHLSNPRYRADLYDDEHHDEK
jgi:hypothetical protein